MRQLNLGVRGACLLSAGVVVCAARSPVCGRGAPLNRECTPAASVSSTECGGHDGAASSAGLSAPRDTATSGDGSSARRPNRPDWSRDVSMPANGGKAAGWAVRRESSSVLLAAASDSGRCRHAHWTSVRVSAISPNTSTTHRASSVLCPLNTNMWLLVNNAIADIRLPPLGAAPGGSVGM